MDLRITEVGPDPPFHLIANPDPTFHFDEAVTHPTLHVHVDPDLAFFTPDRDHESVAYLQHRPVDPPRLQGQPPLLK